jgi:hypothetical protein
MLHRTVLGILAILVISATSGWAQDEGLLSQWYGTGVHAYFSGDTTRALQDLTQAADGGTKDPRVYYFRALTYSRMGYSDAATIDMETGAALESQDRDGRYPVSRSLERIQGNRRLALEKYRRKARVATYQRQLVRRRQRYEALRRQEEQVLRRQIAVPLDRLAVPVSGTAPIEQQVPPTAARGVRSLPPVPAGQPAGGQVMPAPAPVAAESTVPAEQPAASAAPDSAVPGGFAEAPDQSTTPAQGSVQAVPEGEKVGAGQLGKILSRVIGKSLPDGESPAAAAAGGADPFGDNPPAKLPESPASASPAPAEADPFGDTPAPKAKPPAKPPQEPAADDLFGGDTIEEAPQPDPAGATKPAAEPAESDPFGDEADPFGDAEPAADSEPAAADPGKPAPADAAEGPDAPNGEDVADEGNPFADG